MFISKRIAENATAYPSEAPTLQGESHAEIVRSVRETLASFEVCWGKLEHAIVFGLGLGLGLCQLRYVHACVCCLFGAS